MIKCVIFDMDGTLADTLPLCITAFRKSIEELSGKHLTDQQIIDTFGPSEEGTIAALLPCQYDKGVSLYLKYYEELHQAMCPALFPGIPALMEHLMRRHIRSAIVTGKGMKSLAISLRKLGCAELFEHFEAGNPYGPNKQEGIRKVLGKLAIRPEDAIYVGDSVNDIASARAACVPVVSAAWADTANAEELQKHRPDFLAMEVQALINWIERQNRS